MTGKSQIEGESKLISIVQQNEHDFISPTDMALGETDADHIPNRMRNLNAIEFPGIWEALNNQSFKPVEFDTFKKQAGLNSFNLNPKKCIEATQNSILTKKNN